jgi:hypothetical protein
VGTMASAARKPCLKVVAVGGRMMGQH